jgi:hypothetical protein
MIVDTNSRTSVKPKGTLPSSKLPPAEVFIAVHHSSKAWEASVSRERTMNAKLLESV